MHFNIAAQPVATKEVLEATRRRRHRGRGGEGRRRAGARERGSVRRAARPNHEREGAREARAGSRRRTLALLRRGDRPRGARSVGSDLRAALITELGRPPTVGEAPEPAGASLEVLAAPLNPLDRAVAAGKFYGGHPALPYVPGCECVGRVGRRADRLDLRRWARACPERRDGRAGGARSGRRRGAGRRRPGCSRRHSESPGSPAGCRSRGVRRSGRTTACSCSARPAPSERSRFRLARLLGAATRRRGRPRPEAARARARARRRRGGTARRRLRRAHLRLRPAVRRAARAGRRRRRAGSADRPARPGGGADSDASVGRDPGQAARAVRLLGLRRARRTCSRSTTRGWSGTRSPARSRSTSSGSGSTRSARPGTVPASSSSCSQ